MNQHAPLQTTYDPHSAQPRAKGAARVAVIADAKGVTRLRDLRQSGCLKLVFPKTFRPDAEAVLVNTSGGITGGDRLDLTVEVTDGAALTVSTQAAERIYRAQPGEEGRVRNMLSVGPNAKLSWLPQETILFDHAALRRKLSITLDPTAELVLAETLVFGRTAMGEIVRNLSLRDRVSITREGAPLYLDDISLQGDAAAHLARPATAGGAGAICSLVCVSPSVATLLPRLRSVLPRTAGASMIAPDTAVMRILAPDSFVLRQSLIPVLNLLTNNTLPPCWRL
ncbi:urease accessory protein [Sulfitobacter sp. SK012]|uniref:urease accessory protein UreD n=1 Tax=Sulfitobacter sp. SK012 TaxID=1389005 RepID=UPI000E0A2C3F|nr:urease accessory protein UreD [Sulfitobacter sp. SK012]AXI47991.1 urease accessory protein [Sulfitobacter sp. SK012]